MVEHYIVEMSREPRGGWIGLCECGWETAPRRSLERANREAAAHVVAAVLERIDGEHDLVGDPIGWVRAVWEDGELRAVVETATRRPEVA